VCLHVEYCCSLILFREVSPEPRLPILPFAVCWTMPLICFEASSTLCFGTRIKIDFFKLGSVIALRPSCQNLSWSFVPGKLVERCWYACEVRLSPFRGRPVSLSYSSLPRKAAPVANILVCPGILLLESNLELPCLWSQLVLFTMPTKTWDASVSHVCMLLLGLLRPPPPFHRFTIETPPPVMEYIILTC